METLRVASVQFQHVPHDKTANLSIIRRFVEQAKKQDVQMIVFPECCITGYWTLRNLSREELNELSEPICEGPSSQALHDMAIEFDMTIGAGLIERDENGNLYNSYIVAMPDGMCASHRKIHCFISEHMESGNEYTVFNTPYGWRVGVLTCYDNNIIENVRITALKGADILLAPHQTGGCKTPSPFAMGPINVELWENRENDPEAIESEFKGDKGRGWLMRWLPSRAHDNGIFLAFSNGVGRDDDEVRTGNSMILDPYGRILVETWKAGDDMVIADCDPALLEKCTGRRWITSRRPDLYTPLSVPTGRERHTRESRFDL